MSVRPYALRSRWVLPVGRRELWDTLQFSLDSDDPLPWWDLVEVASRDSETMQLVAHSGLGYRLRFTVAELRLDAPETMHFSISGDLVGQAVLRFVPTSVGQTVLLIDWQVELTRRWMRYADPVLRPVFVASHSLVMRRGEHRFRRWLTH